MRRRLTCEIQRHSRAEVHGSLHAVVQGYRGLKEPGPQTRYARAPPLRVS